MAPAAVESPSRTTSTSARARGAPNMMTLTHGPTVSKKLMCLRSHSPARTKSRQFPAQVPKMAPPDKSTAARCLLAQAPHRRRRRQTTRKHARRTASRSVRRARASAVRVTSCQGGRPRSSGVTIGAVKHGRGEPENRAGVAQEAEVALRRRTSEYAALTLGVGEAPKSGVKDVAPADLVNDGADAFLVSLHRRAAAAAMKGPQKMMKKSSVKTSAIVHACAS
eukprot:5981859-Pleurochrysis_carterae.AAC.1